MEVIDGGGVHGRALDKGFAVGGVGPARSKAVQVARRWKVGVSTVNRIAFYQRSERSFFDWDDFPWVDVGFSSSIEAIYVLSMDSRTGGVVAPSS